MAQIKTALLGIVQQLIGGASSGFSAVTVLDDDSVTQVLPLVPEIARRSIAIGPIEGWFVGTLRNIHAAAGGETSSIQVTRPGADAVGAFPQVLPPGFDVWLLGVSGSRTAGTGTLDGSVAALNPPTASQGFGVDSAGNTVITTPTIIVASFTGLVTVVPDAGPFMVTDEGKTFVPVGIRMAPNVTLVHVSEVAGASANMELQFLCGVFPEGMGQDVADF